MYGYGGMFNRANGLFTQAMTGMYGGSDPYNSPFENTTFRPPQQSLPSMLLDVVLRNTLGVRNLITFPNLNEPVAGNLGAYAYSRFRSNQGSLGAIQGQINSASRRALGRAIRRPVQAVFGMDDREADAFVNDLSAGDPYGFVDMGANMVKQFLGMPDYGEAGMYAARRRTGFMLSRMSPAARRMLTDMNPASKNWTVREAAVVGDYARQAREAMYEDGFIRNEKFMRGFSETDLAPLLSTVASSARSGEDIGERIKKVGGAAIKTLEAYKDLFGNAEEAKRVLNQMTAGGWSTMTADRLNSMANQARGLMRIGELNGLAPQEVAGMLRSAAFTVQGGLGYTAGDVAGGYVSGQLVNSVATGFLANQMNNMGAEGRNALDPVEAQKLRARAAFQAGQWASSRSGQSQLAFQFAIARGAIKEGSAQARQIEAMFRSGDVNQMGNAARLVAQALGVNVDTLHDASFVKVASDVVGQDQKRTNALVDIGVTSSTNEARTTFEQTVAGRALDAVRENAYSGGLSSSRVDDAEMRAKINATKQALRENGGSADARRALAYIERIERQSGGDLNAVFAGADEALGMLDNRDAADAIRTKAEWAAANELDAMTRGNVLTGVTNKLAKDLVEKGGGKLGAGGNIERVDAVKILKAIQFSQGVQTNERLKNLVDRAVEEGASNADVAAALNAAGGIVGLARETVAFNNPLDNYDQNGQSTKFGADIARVLSKAGVEVTRRWTLGGVETTEDFGKVNEKLGTAIESIRNSFDYNRDVDKKIKAAKKAGDDARATELETAHGSFSSALGNMRMLRKDWETAQKNGDVEGAKKLEASIQQWAGIAAGAASTLGLSGESVDFLTVFGGENGMSEEVTFGGARVNKEFEDKLFGIAKGIDLFSGFENKNDLFRKLGEIHKNRGSATKEEQAAYRELIKRVKDQGLNISALFDVSKGARAGEDIATADIMSGFGSEMVSGDVFKSAFVAAGSKLNINPEQLEKIGSKIQDIVDDNAASAYATGGQAILRGLQTGDWGGLADTFLRKDASTEERKAFIGKLKSMFGDNVKDENGKIDSKKLMSSVMENWDKLTEWANDPLSLLKGFGGDVSDREANSVGERGESSNNPVYVSIVDGKVSVDDGNGGNLEGAK